MAVVNDQGCTIIYPSAAYDGATNLVSLGEPGEGWIAVPIGEISRPLVDGSMVRFLPEGADP